MKNVKLIALSAILTSFLYQGSALAQSGGIDLQPINCEPGYAWDPIRKKCIRPVRLDRPVESKTE